MDEKLTILEAYCAMRLFLDNYYNLTRSDDIGALLSDLILLNNDAQKSADPAAWKDWMVGVNKILSEKR